MKRINRIAEVLRQEIQSEEIAEGSYLPTEKQLQERFDVSRSSIRRALDELIASGWATRMPNRGVVACRGRVGPKSTMVAFVDHADTLHKSLFFLLGQYLSEKGLHLVHVDSTNRGTLAALESAIDSGFGAAVFWGKEMFLDQNRFHAIQSRLPVVAVDHCPNGITTDVVGGDHYGGGVLAVRHLLQLGRREIAISGFLTMLEDTQQRMLGYAAAHVFASHSVKAHNFVFSSSIGDQAFDDPILFVKRLMDDDRPDAVFVLHDMSAPAIAAAILNLGLRIPEDVAIVGFGNDLPFTLGNVGLTTIAMDWRGIAKALMTRVCQRMDRHSTKVERIVLPSRLIVRGSCGAPEDKWQNDEYQVSSATITRRMPPNVWRSEFGTKAKPPIPTSLKLRSG
ncbi:MAG: GntR family transcriptional regulator [Fimbriimonas sp.]|nr:GntR family transcriptional regulator [Fimbriimonas sp.]